jgi:hypothetical protein
MPTPPAPFPPFTGDTDMTQQCLDHNSPRERSYSVRSNAALGSPLPPITGGQFMRAEMPLLRHPTGEVNAQTQQCRNKSASPNQLQGAMIITQKCQTALAPTEFGPFSSRRNATNKSPNNQRPLIIRRNAIHYTPRNIKRKTNGQEI